MLRFLFACALVVYCVGATRAAAPPSEVRYGLTATEFEAASKDLADKGYYLIQTSATLVGKEVRFAAVWEKHQDWPDRKAQHNLTTKQYADTTAELKEKGYRPVDVCGYEMNGEARFVAIWEKEPKDAPAREARHDLTSNDFRKLYTELTNKGYRPLRINGYTIGQKTRYATIWEKELKGAPLWHMRRDLTPGQYQQVFDEQVEKQFRLVHVVGYTIDGEERFAGIWEKSTGPVWYAHHALDANEYEKSNANLNKQGYRQVQISGYSVGGKLRYAGLWLKE